MPSVRGASAAQTGRRRPGSGGGAPSVHGRSAQSGEAANVLIKRGKELHGPTEMIIPVASIQFLEPVSPDSENGKRLAGS
jgi:hypothetical protein